MRASRLLSLLMLLQSRGRMTAPQLASELEVSVRTIYRDVESLSAAGVPIYADRGPAGGYQLMDGYRTRLTGMTDDEAESLFLAGVPGAAAEFGLGKALAAARLKLLAALPAGMGDRAARIGERFHLDAPGWYHDGEHPPHLPAAAEAVWNQRAIEVRYDSWKGERTRTLEPLGIVLKGGIWYLVARASGQVRTYRVSRILTLKTLDDSFERPGGFNLASYWQTWFEESRGRMYKERAVVRLSPHAQKMLPYLFDSVTVRAASDSATLPDADGWIQVEIPVESIEFGSTKLLQLGADAEILAPAAMREYLRELTRELQNIYAGERPTAREMRMTGTLKVHPGVAAVARGRKPTLTAMSELDAG
ncbi:MAG TPA: YafY family protein [Thermomicrobiales bacterium]|nr:YafY family protein [Thermomicrobiales bacterium]